METRSSIGTVGTKRYLRKKTVDLGKQNLETVPSIRYAGFWMRLWAFLFDLLIVSGINAAFIGTWLPFVQTEGNVYGFLMTAVLVPSFLYAILFFLYFALMTKQFGQTLGKMVFGLRVVTRNGEKLTWTTIFFREGIGRFLHQAPLPLNFPLVMYVVVACTPKKQGIHDLFAETYVVHCD